MSIKKKDTMMLAFDTSSKKTGWAVFKNGEYLVSGIFDFSDVPNTDYRIKLMVKTIFECCNKIHPDIIVVEKDVVMNNMTTINILTKVLGSVYGYCIINDIFYYEYQPNEWRKIIELKTKSRKREDCKKASIQLIKEKLNIDVSDDEADAINVGYAYIKMWS